MSFFDEDDAPPRRQPRPRRARPAAGAAIDSQQIWVRRGVALLVGALVLLLLVLGVNACQDSRRKSSMREYNRQVTAYVRQSDTEVGRGFFDLLQQENSPEDLQAGISGFKEQSETLLDQAERLDVPDELAAAHRSLLVALELRRDGLQFIAERITQATGQDEDAADEAITRIAGQMQAFLASDVLIKARVTPTVRRALEQAEVVGEQPVRTANFLADTGWLDPSAVASALDTTLSEGGRDRRPGEEPAPGLHGTGLQSVAVGDITLQPGVANRVPASEDLTFAVTFQNQGEHDEFDVEVVVALSGPSKVRGTKTVDTVAQGAEATANVTLNRPPRAGEVYTVEVNVRGVPGEQKTDNNRQTYQVLFTQ